MIEQVKQSFGHRLQAMTMAVGLIGLLIPSSASAAVSAQTDQGKVTATGVVKARSVAAKAGVAKKIKVKANFNTFHVTWKAPASAAQFKLIVARDKKMKKVVFKSPLTKRTDWWITRDKKTADKRLAEGTKYWLRIVSYDANGKAGKKSKPKSTTTRVRPPGWVFDVRTQGVGPSSLHLSWQAAKLPTAYRAEIFTRANGKPVATYPIPGAKKTSTTLTNLGAAGIKPGQAFFVKVTSSRFDKLFGESNRYAAALPFTRPTTPPAFTANVASYNVVYSAARDGSGRTWAQRKSAIAARLKGMDLVGLQELKGNGNGVNDIARLTGLTRVARGGAVCSQDRAVDILYNAKKYGFIDCELVALTGDRWLVIAELTEKTSQAHFMIANTHLMNGSSASATKTRTAEAKQVVAALAAANSSGLPVIFTGDFNAADITSDTNPAPLLISQAGYVSADLVAAKQTNFQYAAHHQWTKAHTNCQRIDHIWLNSLVVANAFAVHVATPKNEPSDHYPISATVTVHRAP